MQSDIQFTRLALDSIKATIHSSNIPKAKEWGGGGLEVVWPIVEIEEVSPSRLRVETKHSPELSWLIRELKEIFKSDFESKYRFYGRLGEAALQHQKEHGDGDSPRLLLLAVVEEAHLILSEVEKGDSQFDVHAGKPD